MNDIYDDIEKREKARKNNPSKMEDILTWDLGFYDCEIDAENNKIIYDERDEGGGWLRQSTDLEEIVSILKKFVKLYEEML